VHPIAVAAAILAALIHSWFFVMESVWFMQPAMYRRFGLASDAEARLVRGFAFNQGFYNLFLAVVALVGVVLIAAGVPAAGYALVLAAAGSMIGAGLVLIGSSPNLLRAALVQALPPALGLVALAVGVLL
jgi:putative membrane protein